MKQHRLVGFFGLALYLQGCVIGYDSTLFVTQSNIGLNAETKPPLFEMSIARREGVIAPGFEGGQTPPVMASFRTDSNPFSRFFFGVKSTFAGGNAAVALSKGSEDTSRLCLSKEPDPKKILWVFDASIPKPGAVEPFFFGTDTTFGLKVTWGTNGQYPDSVRLGFSRTEFAWAPVFGTDKNNCKIPGTENPYAVWMPPFLAVLDNDVQTGTTAETGVKWLQYFATGQSATNIAHVPEVREVMLQRFDPAIKLKTFREHQKEQFESFNNIKTAYLNSNEASKQKILQRAKELNLVTANITTDKFTDELAAGVDANNPEKTKNFLLLEAFVKSLG